MKERVKIDFQMTKRLAMQENSGGRREIARQPSTNFPNFVLLKEQFYKDLLPMERMTILLP